MEKLRGISYADINTLLVQKKDVDTIKAMLDEKEIKYSHNETTLYAFCEVEAKFRVERDASTDVSEEERYALEEEIAQELKDISDDMFDYEKIERICNKKF